MQPYLKTNMPKNKKTAYQGKAYMSNTPTNDSSDHPSAQYSGPGEMGSMGSMKSKSYKTSHNKSMASTSGGKY